MPSLYACRAGYEIVAEIGVEAVRAQSLSLTRRLLERAHAMGFRVNTPDRDDERGGAVIVDVPNGAAVTNELISRNVIVDYRPGAGIRIAPHFYNTSDEIDHAMDVLAEIACARSAPDPGSRIPHPGSRS